jgi:hypothetical protein
MVDSRLETAIPAQWHDDSKEELLRELFRDGGALGSFGTRIKVGFAIGLYGEDGLHDLKEINRIRNDFAHRIAFADFQNESIASRCKSLKLPDKYPVTITADYGVYEVPPGCILFDAVLEMLKYSAVGNLPIRERDSFERSRF